jgi:hypothetical protein
MVRPEDGKVGNGTARFGEARRGMAGDKAVLL